MKLVLGDNMRFWPYSRVFGLGCFVGGSCGGYGLALTVRVISVMVVRETI